MNHDELLPHLHSRTAADLGGLLDVEAGLREVLIASQHTRTGQDLDLDIEAGLRAIAPMPPRATPFPEQPRQPSATAPDQAELHGAVAARLMSMDSSDRLTLRNHPVVVELVHSLAFTSAKATSLDLAELLARNRGRGLAIARAIARASALVRELDHARVGDRDLAGYLARARALARDLVRELDRTFDRDHAGYHDLARARDLARDLVRDLVHELHDAIDRHLDRTDARTRDLDRAGALDHDLDLDLDRAGALDLDLAIDRARAIDLARELDLARHDFTQADLSGVDLSTVSLTGVRWSMATTRWPSEEWRAQALLNSRKLNDGTYEIQGGTKDVPIHST